MQLLGRLLLEYCSENNVNNSLYMFNTDVSFFLFL
jgi:hypothetical protein